MSNYRIIQGDSADQSIVDQFKDKEFDIIFTSPPYNVACGFGCKYETKAGEKINRDNIKNYDIWLTDIIKKWLPKCKYFMLNIQELANNKVDLIKIMYELKDYFVDRFYWVKPNGVPSCYENKMVNCIEWVLIFSKYDNTKNVPTNKPFLHNYIYAYGNRNNEYAKIHKALMSIPFCEFIIKTFTKENQNVLDIFGGLGTTALCCEKLNRNCTIIEKEKLYCDKAKERLESAKEQITLF